VDTGPLVALMSRDDTQHRTCTETLAGLTPPLLTCWPVLTETTWLLRRQPSALERFFAAFDAGMIDLLPLDASSMPWIAGFMRRYETLGAQLADAALVYLAERENIPRLFTLDRRDFSVYRLKRNRSLTLLPELQ
jgi:predicted nucleic acid-binding protein